MALWSPNIETVEGGSIAVTNFPATQPISGTVAVSNFPATQPVSGTVTAVGPLTDAQLRATPVPVSGTLSTSPASSGSATVSNVSVGVSSTTLLAANASRLRAIIHNESGTLFVKYGTGASSTSYTYRLVAQTVLEASQYTGIITAVKQSGTSAVLCTEI